MPVYFQACKGASPTGSGVDLFGLAMTLSPISIIGGVSITVFNCYRPQLWFGWSLTVLAMGVISTLDSTSPRAMSIGFEVLAGAGMGIAYTGTFFPVLAPLSVESNAHAIGLGIFLRSFAQVSFLHFKQRYQPDLTHGRSGVLQSVVPFFKTNYRQICLWSFSSLFRTATLLHTEP